jgi:hypothetical protein
MNGSVPSTLRRPLPFTIGTTLASAREGGNLTRLDAVV